MSWEDEDWIVDLDAVETCSKDRDGGSHMPLPDSGVHDDKSACKTSPNTATAHAQLQSWEDEWSDTGNDIGTPLLLSVSPLCEDLTTESPGAPEREPPEDPERDSDTDHVEMHGYGTSGMVELTLATTELPEDELSAACDDTGAPFADMATQASGSESPRAAMALAIIFGLNKGPVRRYSGGVEEEDKLGYFFYDRGCQIANVHLGLDTTTGESDGIGIISFEDHESLAKATSLGSEASQILASGSDSIVVAAVDPSIVSRARSWEDCIQRILRVYSLPCTRQDLSRQPQLTHHALDESSMPEWRRRGCKTASDESSVPEWRRRDYGNASDESNVPEWRRRGPVQRRRVRLHEFQDERDNAENEVDDSAWRSEALCCEVSRSSSVPEWRRPPCRPRLQGEALGNIHWLLQREAAARGVTPLPLEGPNSTSACRQPRRFRVQDGVCQTEKGSDPCAICLQAPRTHACAPCGHCCMCQLCAQRKLARCPICRMANELGVFRIHFELESQQTSLEARRDDTTPEWRRKHRARQEPRKPQMQFDEAALQRLQQLLLTNTTKTIESRACTTRDQACQTDESLNGKCAVCQSASPTYAAWPCGHHCLCSDCHDEWRYSLSCPTCRKPCITFVRIYR